MYLLPQAFLSLYALSEVQANMSLQNATLLCGHFLEEMGSNQEYLDNINSHLQNVCLQIIDFCLPQIAY